MNDNIENEAGKMMSGDGKLLVLPEFKKYDLNIRQAKFAQMKAYGYSNSEAARAAGYSKQYSYQIGYSLMSNQSVVDYINYLQANVAYSYGVSKNMLIEELIDIKNEAKKQNKLQIAITAIKALANIVGMDNGKNPETKSIDAPTEQVQNFLINFTNAIPEEKKKLLKEDNIHPSVDIQILENFNNEIVDDVAEDIMKRVENNNNEE